MSLPGSGLPDIVGNEELTVRFIKSSSWVSKSIARVKYPAYLPAPDNDTSVFRTVEMIDEELWNIADAELAGASIHGASVVSVGIIRTKSLDVVPQEPPHRHANIRGWPMEEDPIERKAKRKEIAMEIAESAQFIPIPTNDQFAIP